MVKINIILKKTKLKCSVIIVKINFLSYVKYPIENCFWYKALTFLRIVKYIQVVLFVKFENWATEINIKVITNIKVVK